MSTSLLFAESVSHSKRYLSCTDTAPRRYLPSVSIAGSSKRNRDYLLSEVDMYSLSGGNMCG